MTTDPLAGAGVRRAFGHGPSVSLFTLGTMRALRDKEQMLSILRAAYAAGINHLETAPAYGPAETFLGQALDQLAHEGIAPAGGWLITSKLLPGLSFEQGQCALSACLERIGRPFLHGLAVHGLNREEHLHWALDGDGARLLDWALSRGLVGQVGFSSHGSNSLIARAISSGNFRFCSLHLHLLDPGRLPLAQEALRNGMGVMAISPADKGGRLQAPSQLLKADCQPWEPLALAYRYLLAAGISTLTVGASNPSDLNLAAAMAMSDGQLTHAEQAALNRLEQLKQQRLSETLCNQCSACLPCPMEVPIPELLRLRNLRLGHDLKEFTEERYNLIGRAGHWWEEVNAEGCEQCGDCLPRCPHQLAIPELLAETHQLLAAAPRRRLWG
ncbi:MAG: aldo/keto reductase [Synechococcus sp. NP17]|nr:aldo/keto reductase [Synechococcus sp. NP17]